VSQSWLLRSACRCHSFGQTPRFSAFLSIPRSSHRTGLRFHRRLPGSTAAELLPSVSPFPRHFHSPARLCDFSITAGPWQPSSVVFSVPIWAGLNRSFCQASSNLPFIRKDDRSPPMTVKSRLGRARVGLGREHRLRHRSDTGMAIW
jgi:hypothetical protein